MTISSQEKHNFSLCSCFHAQHFSKYWGGTNAWAVPTSNFGGTVPPVPLGFRPSEYAICIIGLRGMDSPVCRFFMVFVRRPLITGSESKRGNPYIKYIWGTIGGAW